MTLTVRVLPEAAAELDAALERYDFGGQGRGVVFESEYESVLDRCLMWPDSGFAYAIEELDVVVRTAKIGRSAFRVVYFVDGEILWIVAVAHERRNPGYWKGRLNDG